ncbi:MAG TPA: sigma-70 family RNA polymerase sigma factor [Blastocatellia bacterium]|nr:sigma-70 family RNA polymerase sigma factor [Blastocatellia bacterium]
MLDLTNKHLERLITQSYTNAYAFHGDLGLNPETFSTHLSSIIGKRPGVASPPALEFVANLYLDDLYLTLACSQGSTVAWERFVSLYEDSIRRICKCVCPSTDAAKELTDSLPGQLFLPGATGHSRIASYQGLSPLASWLGVVVRRMAEKKRHLKSNNLESIEQIPDVADQTSVLKIEASLRASKYHLPIKDSLRCAIILLSDRERVILSLRYEQELRVSHIARQLGVSPHAITQQLDRSSQKIRKQIISILVTRYRLAPAAVEECVADLLSNPGHYIVGLWR